MDTTSNNNVVKDYSKYLSKSGKLRKPSPIRELFKYTKDPSVISLGGGLPNPTAFPFKKMIVELKNGETMTIEGEPLSTALQYTPTYGIPTLVSWLKALQIHNHNLPADQSNEGKGWNLGITSGSQEGLALVLSTLLDEHDSIITESPTYSGTLSILLPMNLNIVGIDIDSYGMKPDTLENVLSNWNTLQAGKPFPKVLYTIPTGQNPSGCTMNTQRKKDIYAVCSKYDLILLEDDPYYYLQFDGEKREGTDLVMGESMLSMDVDQRVIRFDSLSKVLSSGLRLGFVTGPFKLIEVMQFVQQSTTLHACGISQTIVVTLLDKWGIEGFHKHIAHVQQLYKERRDSFIGCVERHLKGLVEYNVPTAGMFVWFKVKNSTDTLQLIGSKALEKKVVLVPGVAFSPNQNLPSPYVRASFSLASNESMDEACKRFASLIIE